MWVTLCLIFLEALSYIPHFLSFSALVGVIYGGWSCWSPWSTCSGNRRLRSRSCSNPTPQNGGRSCIGEPTETSDCEDQHIQYLTSEGVETLFLLLWSKMYIFNWEDHSLNCIYSKSSFHTDSLFFKLFLHRTMEPQCFDLTLPAKQKCGVPPALINGYIMVKMKSIVFKAPCGLIIAKNFL